MTHLLTFLFVLMLTSATAQPSATVTVLPDNSLVSVPLNRAVNLTIILPPFYSETGPLLPVLYLNDGQDLPRLRMSNVLDSLYKMQTIKPFVLVAIHANVDRIQEYGTAAQPDYMKRGSKANAYTDFVLTELLPYIQKRYRVSVNPAQCAIAGFSLGGLSAFDIGFHHPDKFSRAGVFSGSFWWRKKKFNNAYDDETDRIMHSLIRESNTKPALQFWLQTGTNDETSDRNNNGIIDSIDDTLDIINELEKKGYRREYNGEQRDIRYVEVPGGEHNQQTWSTIMPDFLHWAFGK